MKKYKQTLILAMIFSIILAAMPSLPVLAANVGDEIGEVLNTDIKTYINGERIPSYNINNKSAVFIKDLANYGFDTAYSDKTRSTTITYNPKKEVTPLKDFDETTGKVGTVAFKYVYTNITAVINGKEIDCFNIKGNNAIYFNELGEFGTFAWDGAKRESKFTLGIQNVPQGMSYDNFPNVPDFKTINAEYDYDIYWVIPFDYGYIYLCDFNFIIWESNYTKALKNCGYEVIKEKEIIDMGIGKISRITFENKKTNTKVYMDLQALHIDNGESFDIYKYIYISVDKKITKEIMEIPNNFVPDLPKPTSFGDLEGNITYFYNDSKGTVGDVGSAIIIVPTNGNARSLINYPSTSFASADYNDNKILNKYGIYVGKADGTGFYSIQNIPVGEYRVLIRSNHISVEQRENISSEFNGFLNAIVAKSLSYSVGYNKCYMATITIRDNKVTKLSNDFGKSVKPILDTTTTPQSTPKIPVYSSYPSVPDFGAYFGLKLVSEGELNGTVAYFYYATDVTTNMIREYHLLLIDLGFSTNSKIGELPTIFTDKPWQNDPTLMVTTMVDRGLFFVGIGRL